MLQFGTLARHDKLMTAETIHDKFVTVKAIRCRAPPLAGDRPGPSERRSLHPPRTRHQPGPVTPVDSSRYASSGNVCQLNYLS
jgi:hypothetical protein